MLNKEELKKKTNLLNNAEKTLKSEFIGIDDVIEQVMNNIKAWYLFPEVLDRPLIINLFGMTGCGKTSLVKRLVELLELDEDMIYFNFAMISESSTWDVENMFDDEIGNYKPNRVIIYDEFQYAATIDGKGMEKDNKSALKTFWELLDDGKIIKKLSYDDIRYVGGTITWIERIQALCKIKIEDGKWVNHKECLSAFTQSEISTISDYLQIPKDDDDRLNNDCYRNESSIAEENFIIKTDILRRLFRIYNKQAENSNMLITDFIKLFNKNDINEIYDLIIKVVSDARKGYTLDFSKSVIFVLANIDEAYAVSYDMNPDMSPDQFHKITEKISIVDIKESLQKRFRNEQISRLGNIIIRYTSFSTDSFKKIIERCLKRYSDEIKERYGLTMLFDDSIKKIIYNDSVFPTQGTRPIFSSIYEIIKSKLPHIMEYGYEKDSVLGQVIFSFENNKNTISIFDTNNEPIGKLEFKETLRVDNLRKGRNLDEQAITAVHESGHFVMYAKLYGQMPEKLCSRTASSDNGGFLMRAINEDGDLMDNRNSLLDTIRVTLGGYVAERLVFGTNYQTSGATNDLLTATKIASTMIRKFGMGNNNYVTTYSSIGPDTHDCTLIKDETKEMMVNEEIRNILCNCEKDVERTLKSNQWCNMLKLSSQYLAVNPNMPKDKMLEIYNTVPEEIRESAITTKSHKPDYYVSKVKEWKLKTDKMS